MVIFISKDKNLKDLTDRLTAKQNRVTDEVKAIFKKEDMRALIFLGDIAEAVPPELCPHDDKDKEDHKHEGHALITGVMGDRKAAILTLAALLESSMEFLKMLKLAMLMVDTGFLKKYGKMVKPMMNPDDLEIEELMKEFETKPHAHS